MIKLIKNKKEQITPYNKMFLQLNQKLIFLNLKINLLLIIQQLLNQEKKTTEFPHTVL